jgi:hypothetical protein
MLVRINRVLTKRSIPIMRSASDNEGKRRVPVYGKELLISQPIFMIKIKRLVLEGLVDPI